MLFVCSGLDVRRSQVFDMADFDQQVQIAQAAARRGIALLYKYPREVISHCVELLEPARTMSPFIILLSELPRSRVKRLTSANSNRSVYGVLIFAVIRTGSSYPSKHNLNAES